MLSDPIHARIVVVVSFISSAHLMAFDPWDWHLSQDTALCVLSSHTRGTEVIEMQQQSLLGNEKRQTQSLAHPQNNHRFFFCFFLKQIWKTNTLIIIIIKKNFVQWFFSFLKRALYWKAAFVFCAGNYSLLSFVVHTGLQHAALTHESSGGLWWKNPCTVATVLLHRRHAVLASATQCRELGGTVSTAEHSATHTPRVFVLAPGWGRHQRRSLKSISVFGPWEANRAWHVANSVKRQTYFTALVTKRKITSDCGVTVNEKVCQPSSLNACQGISFVCN